MEAPVDRPIARLASPSPCLLSLTQPVRRYACAPNFSWLIIASTLFCAGRTLRNPQVLARVALYRNCTPPFPGQWEGCGRL